MASGGTQMTPGQLLDMMNAAGYQQGHREVHRVVAPPVHHEAVREVIKEVRAGFELPRWPVATRLG